MQPSDRRVRSSWENRDWQVTERAHWQAGHWHGPGEGGPGPPGLAQARARGWRGCVGSLGGRPTGATVVRVMVARQQAPPARDYR